jgi:hypothetical protein
MGQMHRVTQDPLRQQLSLHLLTPGQEEVLEETRHGPVYQRFTLARNKDNAAVQ